MIGENEEQLGVLPTFEAMRLAREAGLDLVEVAPNVRPPVCRIMDYGKWKYRQKKNVKKHHEQQLKEIRIRPKTDDHDREIKMEKAADFFRKGDKVQFTMQFKGRERAHREIGFSTFKEILDEYGLRVKVERPPSMEGRNMIMILIPVKGAFGPEKPPAHEKPAAPKNAVKKAPAPELQGVQAERPSDEVEPAEQPERATAPAAESNE